VKTIHKTSTLFANYATALTNAPLHQTCLPVCSTHITTSEPMNAIPYNVILMDFTTNCQQIPIFFKTVQKERILHKELYNTLPITQESLLKY